MQLHYVMFRKIQTKKKISHKYVTLNSQNSKKSLDSINQMVCALPENRRIQRYLAPRGVKPSQRLVVKSENKTIQGRSPVWYSLQRERTEEQLGTTLRVYPRIDGMQGRSPAWTTSCRLYGQFLPICLQILKTHTGTLSLPRRIQAGCQACTFTCRGVARHEPLCAVCYAYQPVCTKKGNLKWECFNTKYTL